MKTVFFQRGPTVQDLPSDVGRVQAISRLECSLFCSILVACQAFSFGRMERVASCRLSRNETNFIGPGTKPYSIWYTKVTTLKNTEGIRERRWSLKTKSGRLFYYLQQVYIIGQTCDLTLEFHERRWYHHGLI